MTKIATLRADLLGRLSALQEQQRVEESVAGADVRIWKYCERVTKELYRQDFDGRRATMANFGLKVLAVKGDVMITAVLDPGFMPNEGSSGRG